MFGYVSIPQPLIDRAVAQIKEQVGTAPSLVWAIALENVADEIRQQCAKQQINISGLDFDIENAN